MADNEAAKLRSIIDQTIPSARSCVPTTSTRGRAGDLLGTLTLHSADTRAAAAEDSRVGLEALREAGSSAMSTMRSHLPTWCW